MNSDSFPIAPPVASRLLTAEQFQRLADAPPKSNGSPISATRPPAAPTKTPLGISWSSPAS